MTTTPNLGLRVDSTATPNSKYNLYRIDSLAARLNIALTGDTYLSSTSDITIQAQSGTGIAQINGNVNITAGNLQSADYTSAITLRARTINLLTEDNVDDSGPTKAINIKANSIALTASDGSSGVSLTGISLSTAEVFVGNNLGVATARAVSGDLSLTSNGLWTVVSEAITEDKIAPNSISTDKLVDGAVTNEKLADNILWSKLDLSFANLADLPLRHHSSLQEAGSLTHSQLDAHVASLTNPHATTAAQVGAYDIATTDALLAQKATLSSLTSHTGNYNNPHVTTKAQILAGNPILNADVADGANISTSKISGLDAALAVLPIPTPGEAGKVLTATGINTATWQQSPSSDGRVYTSATDTTKDYLYSKLTGGTGITLSKVGDPGNATITIASSITYGNLTGTATRTSITGGTGAIVGSGATIDVATSLLPSPVSGDVGKALLATGANTAAWSIISTADEKLKVSATDTTAAYLTDKLLAGSGVSLTVAHDPGNATLTLANTDGGAAAISAHLLAINHAPLGQAADASHDGYLAKGDWSTFSGKQPGDADLTAIAALTGPGFAVKTTTDPTAPAWTNRTIGGTSNRISVSNGDGVAGNPTINLDTSLLPSPSTANGLLVASGANTAGWSTALTFDGSLLKLNQNTAVGPTTLAGSAICVHGADNAQVRIGIRSFGTAGINSLSACHARGSAASPSAIQAGDTALSLDAWGYGATAYSSTPKAKITAHAAENWTDSNQGTYLSLWTTPKLSTVVGEKLRIYDDGGVRVGGSYASSPGASIVAATGFSGPLTGNVTGNADTSTTAGNVTGVVAVANGGTAGTTPTTARQGIGAQTTFGGLEDNTAYSVAYDPATRTLTITYTGTTYFTVLGVRYSRTGSETITHANTVGIWYFYYNSGGTLTASQSFWDLLSTAQIALVYYCPSNAGGAASGKIQTELHPGINGMDNATHLNLHVTRGSQMVSVPSISGYTLNASGLANISYALSTGTIADEDLILTTAAQAQGGANTYRLNYKTNLYTFTIAASTIAAGAKYTSNGNTFTVITGITGGTSLLCASSNGAPTAATSTLTYVSGNPGDTGNKSYSAVVIGTTMWNWIDQAEGGIYSNGTDIYYNQLVGGAWKLTPQSSNGFVNYWVLATTQVHGTTSTTSTNTECLILMGQATYANLAAAQAATFASEMTDVSALTNEAVVLYQLTYQRSGAFGAPGNSRLISVAKVTTSITTIGAGNAVTASNVSVATAGFSGMLSSANTTVQAALQTIDKGIAYRYTAALSWTGAGPYTMSVTGATHQRGTDPVIRVRQLVSGSLYDVVTVDIQVDDSSGDVTVTSSENFTGKLVIL